LRTKQRFSESAVSFHLGDKTFTKNPQHSITFVFYSGPRDCFNGRQSGFSE